MIYILRKAVLYKIRKAQFGLTLEYPFLKDARLVFLASYRRSPQLNFDMIDQRYNSFSLGAGIKLSIRGNN